MFKPFSELLKHRRIIYSTTIRDLKTKNAGSILGVAWLVFYPVIFLALYAFIYLMVFKVRLNMLSPYEYVMLIFAGLIPFLSFAEALGRGVNAVTSNSNLIRNTLFPIEFIPVNIVISSQVILFVGFIMLTVALASINKIGWHLLYVPLVMVIQFIFTLGVVWIISSLNVFFKDLGQVISLIVLMLMMISPIAYTEDMIPETLRGFLYFNPLYYLIIIYQNLFLFNNFPQDLFWIFLVISLVVFILGYYLFVILKGVFNDYI